MLAFFKFIFICFEVILIFNLIVLVHELGHFWAARWRGVHVDKFQIWFGKAIFKKVINGVQWGIGWIPAGGFVALPQMAPMESIEGKREDDKEGEEAPRNLPAIKPLDKIIVAFAGPLFSLLLALAFAFIVWKVGRPVPKSNLTTTIGYVEKDSPADKAGLKIGDKILAIDENPVKSWVSGLGDDVRTTIIAGRNKKIKFDIEREGQKQVIFSNFEIEESTMLRRPNFRQVGILPFSQPMVESFTETSVAKEAGLRKQDVLVAINGKKINYNQEVNDAVSNSEGKSIEFTVRQAYTKDFRKITITPVFISLKKYDKKLTRGIPPEELEKKAWRIGVIFNDKGETDVERLNPFSQVIGSAKTMWNTISAVASPKSDVSVRHLSGPIGILNLYYRIFEDKNGWKLALWFSVFLNVNLAILNLLPFPVLDGGHITLAIAEALRGKPMKTHILEKLQTAFALLLIGFMIYITFFDIQDLAIFK